jgi:hypothetical protein
VRSEPDYRYPGLLVKTLREEIIQAHSTRSELLKWKLAIVGVVGSVGLGLAGAKTSKHADLVLAALPLICIYVDLLCMNLNVRMLVIAAWMRGHETTDSEDLALKDYEQFVKPLRKAFALEDWAMNWSTRVVSAAVGLYGGFGDKYGHASTGVTVVFITSGAIGLLGSLAADYWAYRRNRRNNLPEPA